MDIQMSDFTLPPEPENRQPWEDLRTYHASITQDDVRAIISLRWYAGQAQQYQLDTWLYPPGYVQEGNAPCTQPSVRGSRLYQL